MRESKYERSIVKKLELLFPGCIILKNDSSYKPGIPDRLILWGPYWAMLEIKRSAVAAEQPNQGYYVAKLNEMSFAAFIYPAIEEEVLYGLQEAFGISRPSRVS